MKMKYYLRGLGMGLVIATFLLSLFYMYKTSDSKIIEKAKTLGMVMEDDIEKKNTEKNQEEEKTTEEKTTEEKTTEEKTTEEKTTEEKTTEETTIEQTTTEEATTIGTYTITITAGMSSEQLARSLESAGVVASYKEFNRFMKENGYAKKIEKGTYTFAIGSSFEDIANAVIKK